MVSSRFEELNSRCKKLKNKKLWQISIYTVLSVIAIALLLYLILPKTEKKSVKNIAKKEKKSIIYKNSTKIKKDKNIKKIQKKKLLVKKTTVEKPTINKIEQKKVNKLDVKNKKIKKSVDKITLEPVFSMDNLLSNTIKQTIKQEKVKPKEIKKETIAAEEQNISKQDTNQTDTFKKKSNPVKISTQKSDIKTILFKNYNALKNYDNALALAKYFFDKHQYKVAISWAITASKFDKTAKDPWIYYAKSKYKLGDKKSAVKSLEVYLKYFPSSEVYALLDKIKRGEY